MKLPPGPAAIVLLQNYRLLNTPNRRVVRISSGKCIVGYSSPDSRPSPHGSDAPPEIVDETPLINLVNYQKSSIRTLIIQFVCVQDVIGALAQSHKVVLKLHEIARNSCF